MNPSTEQQQQAEDGIRFIMDGEVITLPDADPTCSVLQYLREDAGRTGTKEGCAEGDCGACTALLGELVGGRIQLRAINTCILFLPTLDGKILFTVESLKYYGDARLHPAQQAMVDNHGSQCGFCTPGFIMSMLALYKSIEKPTRDDVSDFLSGNLCRCTGYRPIIDAALKMNDYPVSSDDSSLLHQGANATPDEDELALIAQLHQIQRQQTLTLTHQGREYCAPVTLDAFAAHYLQHPDSHILAGGTDIGLWVTKQLRQLEKILYLGRVAELNRITSSPSHIDIGAAVSLTDAFATLAEAYPEITELFRRFASIPIRNSGTLGGNIANGSPIGDSMPVLITLGTRLILRKGSERRELPLELFYTGYQKKDLAPGEFVETIRVPRNLDNRLVRSYKIAKRFDQDISAVCAAFCIKLEGETITEARIAYGGMAAKPQRASQAEAILIGQSWDEATAQAAMVALAQDYTPLSDMRASASYRMKAAQNSLYRFYLETRPQAPLSVSQINAFNRG